MQIHKALIVLTLFLAIAFSKELSACSMYKLTVGDKTMVGCNEDAWRTTPRIWFEPAQETSEYGAGFTGSRQVDPHRFAPQSGMNEAGLVFSRLASYYPVKTGGLKNKRQVPDEVSYLSGILHKCATVDEVAGFINEYDHSIFIDDVFIYIDRAGNYLIVEPYDLILGSDANYVLSNFCPSITRPEQANQIVRYKNGVDYLQARSADTTLDYCTSLSDTMHVCRSRNGDGTLLTSIWDTKNLSVSLYFYHQYDSTVSFDLRNELAKGAHAISLPERFPQNPEFERLAGYKTPFNTPSLRIALVVTGGILIFFAFLFGLFLLKNRNRNSLYKTIVPLIVLNFVLTAYLAILATNSYIYYFDTPYKHPSSGLISASSFTPFILLLVIGPATYFTIKQTGIYKTRPLLTMLIVSNNLIYLLLMASFGYWGLYNVWN